MTVQSGAACGETNPGGRGGGPGGRGGYWQRAVLADRLSRGETGCWVWHHRGPAAASSRRSGPCNIARHRSPSAARCACPCHRAFARAHRHRPGRLRSGGLLRRGDIDRLWRPGSASRQAGHRQALPWPWRQSRAANLPAFLPTPIFIVMVPIKQGRIDKCQIVAGIIRLAVRCGQTLWQPERAAKNPCSGRLTGLGPGSQCRE
jgi:hypothetical protein